MNKMSGQEEQLQPLDGSQHGPLVTVVGQVLHKRALSKKIVFLDIKVRPGPQHDGASMPTHLELVVKLGTFGEISDVEHARDSCSLGDVVQATGWIESNESCTMLVTALTHISRWAEGCPPSQRAPAFQPDPESVAWWNQAYSARKKATVPTEAAVAQGCNEQQQASDNAPGSVPAAAVPSDGPAAAAAVCKFWINTGRCARDDTCLFAHPLGQHVKGTRRQYLHDRLATRKVGAAEDGFFIHGDGEASAKRARAAVFARWLVDTWGKDALNAGSGVLDVAGGRGALSWELQVVHGVKVTLVEPRPFKLSKYQHKALKAMRKAQQRELLNASSLQEQSHHDMEKHHQLQQQAGSVGTSVHDQPQQGTGSIEAQEEEEEAKQQVQLGTSEHAAKQGAVMVQRLELAPGIQITQVLTWFDEPLWKAAASYQQQQQQHATVEERTPQEELGCQQQQQEQQRRQQQLQTNATGLGTGQEHRQQHSTDSIVYPEDVLQCIANCSVVVGLHPDQATESIIQYANLPPGKAYAIVPCCVFPRLYPHRRLHAQLKPEFLAQAVAGERQGQTDDAADGGMWDAPYQLLQQCQASIDDGLLLPKGYELAIQGTDVGTVSMQTLQVPVTRYLQLVAWLQQQGGHAAKTCCLAMEGANRVIYRQQGL